MAPVVFGKNVRGFTPLLRIGNTSTRSSSLRRYQPNTSTAVLLNVALGERAAVLELLAGKDEALLIRRDAILVLNLLLHRLDGVGRVDVERDGLPVSVLTKICMPEPPRRRKTRWRVDSF